MAIYKDNNKFYFRCYYTNLSGERKQYKSKRYDRKSEAQEEERIFLMNNTNINESNITFSELYTLYYQFQKTQVKISTLVNIEKRHSYLEPLNNIKVKDFSLTQFNNWKNGINKTKLATNTKNNIYRLLRALINYGNKYYDLNNNVINKMTNFTNPNELKKEMLFFDYEEFSKFISVEENTMWNTFFCMLYYCGLRLGEIKALTWKDIDLEKNTLSVNKSIISKMKGQRYIISTPKTKGSIRVIQFSKKVAMGLKTMYNEDKQYKDFSKSWFIFGDSVPLGDTTIQNRKNNNCQLANVKQIRIHDFRHSCASLLINNKANITLVAKYLGHTNIATTLNTYSHFYNNEFDDIIKKIDNL